MLVIARAKGILGVFGMLTAPSMFERRCNACSAKQKNGLILGVITGFIVRQVLQGDGNAILATFALNGNTAPI